MKAAITGHTRGIGQALYQELFQKGYHVVGYSRSNGYDISCEVDRRRILNESKDFDIFVNNAYSPGSQFDLLKELVAQWQGQRKMILNVSSKAVYADIVPDFMKSYVEDKKSQIDFISKQKLKATPQILNLILGLTDTEMSRSLEARKLDPKKVAELIASLLEFKDQIYVQDLMIDVPYQDWKDIRPKIL
jgi:F0F1-type ATP synthase delta subunit